MDNFRAYRMRIGCVSDVHRMRIGCVSDAYRTRIELLLRAQVIGERRRRRG
jgi:hypothetical protein